MGKEALGVCEGIDHGVGNYSGRTAPEELRMEQGEGS